MLNLENIQIDKIIVHKVGNASREEGIAFSQKPLDLQEDTIKDLLVQYFLKPFKSETYYHFHHEVSLESNRTFELTSQLFEDASQFQDTSQQLAQYLYECSTHAQIKAGEFYLVYFRDVIVEDEVTDVLGLFKSENKETYLKVIQREMEMGIEVEQGININKLDKGCLIFNTEKEQGFKVSMVDNLNKGNEAQYWRDQFLQIKIREDNFYHTQNYMEMCKGFVDEVYNEENEVEKTEQIHLMNRSLDFFNGNESFDIAKFEEEVMVEPEVISAFREYKQDFVQEHDVEIQEEEFDISAEAVKSGKKKMKSVLKLDKNFHVYIHGGGQDKIEKGYDEVKGMHYYQLFFEEES